MSAGAGSAGIIFKASARRGKWVFCSAQPEDCFAQLTRFCAVVQSFKRYKSLLKSRCQRRAVEGVRVTALCTKRRYDLFCVLQKLTTHARDNTRRHAISEVRGEAKPSKTIKRDKSYAVGQWLRE
ncbi:hypothetical protein AA106555_0113 [Neokomagataea thailandica NBRC 106555]|uniref:Transposase n=1 Tax=Neokomagataea thailandica NBRC 106555 TaxID=1223520 RepID=A0ABQ0QM70_9PROT|nr:hypothetical protein AA106555_0113 [Neokomagataea thailandica NBRC 106555]